MYLQVYRVAGYCPQFDALFDGLTGRETLYMFALMRGLRMRTAAPTVHTLAHALGFTKHLDKKVFLWEENIGLTLFVSHYSFHYLFVLCYIAGIPVLRRHETQAEHGDSIHGKNETCVRG